PHPNPLPEGAGTKSPPRRFHEASSPFTVERELRVSIETSAKAGEVARPGDDVEVTVTATDPRGKPVEAELSLAMIEQALWEMFGANASPIADFFRGQPRASAVRTASSVTFAYHPATLPINPQLLAEKDRLEVQAMEEDRRKLLIAESSQVPSLHRPELGAQQIASEAEAKKEIRQELEDLVKDSLSPITWDEVSAAGELPTYRNNLGLVIEQEQADADLDGTPVNEGVDSPYEADLAARGANQPSDGPFNQRRRPRGNMMLESSSLPANGVTAGDAITAGLVPESGAAGGMGGFGGRQSLGRKSGGESTRRLTGKELFGESKADDAKKAVPDSFAYFAAPEADALINMNTHGQQNPTVLMADGTQRNWQLGLNFTVPDGKKLREAAEKLKTAGAVLLPAQGSQETAYWNPAIVTDEDGKATVTITLPERTTAWKLLAKGITAE
ncbi:MAG: alpha-2-macroglobulin family protein, partial [Pirellulales bacterium]